jgi:hypothetical protein
MQKIMMFLLVCSSWAAAVWADEAIPPKMDPDSARWESLFAEDLSNAIYPEGIWRWEKGELTATEDKIIWTKKEYRNCIIDLEFRNDPGSNSGVFVYGSDLSPEKKSTHSVEIQILDDYADKWTKDNPAKKWTKVPPSWQCGGIFGRLAPNKQVVKHAGQWNRMTITCQGQKISVRLNGTLVTEMDMSKWTSGQKNPDGTPIPPWLSKPLAQLPTKGHIGLQGKHGGVPIHFRNVKVKELGG